MTKLICQVLVSLSALAGGFYIVVAEPELREWGIGLIALIIGYWVR